MISTILLLATRTHAPAAKSAPVVRSAAVVKGTLTRTLRIPGMTMARSTAMLVAPRLYGRRSRNSSGNDFRLTLRTLAAPGSQVKQGEVVAEFDRQFIETRLDDLAADVRSRELTLAKVRAGLTERRKAYEQRILAAEGVVEKSRLDLRTIPVRSAIVAERYRLNLEEARAQLEQLRKEVRFFNISEAAEMKRQELELEQERLDLRRGERGSERMMVRSPIDGVFVPQRIRRGGEYMDIKAGDDLPSGTVIGEVHDTSRLNVEAYVNQADAHLLRSGMEAVLTVEAMPDVRLPARITRIGSIAKGGGSRREFVSTIPVRLSVEGSREVMPNFTVAADVALASSPDSLLAPREAVHRDGSGAFVYLRAGGSWQRRPVMLGAHNHVQVAVTGGLTLGDVVALERPIPAR